MSKQYIYTTGPHKNLSSPGPATVEEFDAAAGQGAALAYAMAEAIYRGHLPTLQDKILPIYKDILGKEPLVDETKTKAARERAKEGAKVADVKENIVPFLTREYELASADDKVALDKAVRDLAAATFIDVSEKVREARGPGKQVLEAATAKLTQSVDEIEKTVSTILAKCPNQQIDRDEDGKPTVESLAFAIKAFKDALAAESAAALGL